MAPVHRAQQGGRGEGKRVPDEGLGSEGDFSAGVSGTARYGRPRFKPLRRSSRRRALPSVTAFADEQGA